MRRLFLGRMPHPAPFLVDLACSSTGQLVVDGGEQASEPAAKEVNEAELMPVLM
jgi:hypothetical protein